VGVVIGGRLARMTAARKTWLEGAGEAR